MALCRDDFPEEQQEIQDHVQTCDACQKELSMLQDLRELIVEHRRELTDCVAECPSPAAIVELSLGESSDPILQSHIEDCSRCREELDLLKALHKEQPQATSASAPTTEEKIVIRNAVARELRKSPPPPFAKLRLGGTISAWLRSLFSPIHAPSMALGAVAAAVLVFVVMLPPAAVQTPFKPALSDVFWEGPQQAGTKIGGPFEPEAGPAKKVAPIILVSESVGLSQTEIDRLYKDLPLAVPLGTDDEFLSPADVKKALESLTLTSRTPRQVVSEIFSRSTADLALVFEITGLDRSFNVKATLFSRTETESVPPISQAGLSRHAIANSMRALGAALLAQRAPAE